MRNRYNKKTLDQVRHITEMLLDLSEDGRDMALKAVESLSRAGLQENPDLVPIEQHGGTRPRVQGVAGVISYSGSRKVISHKFHIDHATPKRLERPSVMSFGDKEEFKKLMTLYIHQFKRSA